MDFEESDGDDEESDDSGDSGQGGDENVAETNEEDNDDDTGSDVGADGPGPEEEVEGAAAGAAAALPLETTECGARSPLSPLGRARSESGELRLSPRSPARVPDQGYHFCGF